MTSKFSINHLYSCNHTTKSGYPPSARLLVRPTTALQVGEQCDTHERLLIYP
jgi:hypothetical protein